MRWDFSGWNVMTGPKETAFSGSRSPSCVGTLRLPTNHVRGADACRRLKYVFWCFIILSYHFNILLCISMYNIIITSRGLENLSLPLSWARVCSSRWTLCASSGRLLLAARTSIHGNWDGFTAVRRAFPHVWPNPRHFRDYLFYKCETSLSLCAPFSFVPGLVWLQVNVDSNTVGWYQTTHLGQCGSPMGAMAAWWTKSTSKNWVQMGPSQN